MSQSHIFLKKFNFNTIGHARLPKNSVIHAFQKIQFQYT